jgi:hypothetical protein
MQIQIMITTNTQHALEQAHTAAQQYLPSLQPTRWSVTMTLDAPDALNPDDLIAHLSGMPGLTIRMTMEEPQ